MGASQLEETVSANLTECGSLGSDREEVRICEAFGHETGFGLCPFRCLFPSQYPSHRHDASNRNTCSPDDLEDGIGDPLIDFLVFASSNSVRSSVVRFFKLASAVLFASDNMYDKCS